MASVAEWQAIANELIGKESAVGRVEAIIGNLVLHSANQDSIMLTVLAQLRAFSAFSKLSP